MSIIPKNWHHSWDEFMNSDNIKKIKDIENKIQKDFYPEEKNVLRFLNNDLTNIKCVIVGMEPYCTSYIDNGKNIPQATGRSFEVACLKGKTWDEKFKQSSLRNILKTIYFNETGKINSLENIRNEIKNNKFDIVNPDELFDELEKQGVLFLNATLTVKPNKVDSHTKYWNNFMNSLIKYIDNDNITWLLWGNKAQERIIPLIKNNYIVCVHPRLSQFVNQNCFQYIKDINWRCK